jgi:magnesium chelatase family protein
MRQPLEDGHVTIVRAAASVRFPAQFTLVGAANPCNCGFAGDPSGRCICTSAEIAKYRGRISGPLADRIDLHVNVSAVPVRQFGDQGLREKSADVRCRVESARAAQRIRYAKMPGDVWNGRVPGRWLDRHGDIKLGARELLAATAERLGISARGYHRVLRVARTIADLDGERAIESRHIAEALRYRPVVAVRPDFAAPLAVEVVERRS